MYITGAQNQTCPRGQRANHSGQSCPGLKLVPLFLSSPSFSVVKVLSDFSEEMNTRPKNHRKPNPPSNKQ